MASAWEERSRRQFPSRMLKWGARGRNRLRHRHTGGKGFHGVSIGIAGQAVSFSSSTKREWVMEWLALACSGSTCVQ